MPSRPNRLPAEKRSQQLAAEAQKREHMKRDMLAANALTLRLKVSVRLWDGVRRGAQTMGPRVWVKGGAPGHPHHITRPVPHVSP